MLTLRVIPPRLIRAGAPDPRDVTALYFDRLWRHWSAVDRATALALAGLAGARNLALGGREAFRFGWDGAEDTLVGDDRAAHLGMAARKGLHRLINPAAYPLAANPLKNKRLFAERCREAGLPVPRAFEGEASELARWLAGEKAVLAKPNFASKGAGVAGYRRSRGAWLRDGARCGESVVLAELRRAHAAGAIIQRACATHSGLAAISPGALPTLRVMTAINEHDALEVCDRVIRMSAGGPRAVDNFNAGNIVASIDVQGRVSDAYRRGPAGIERVDIHPASGVVLRGTPLPDLEAAQALALRAHEAFRDGFAVIGWDVGLTDRGPVLIEGNWNPGPDILQLVSGRGLGASRLGAIYRHHLAAAPSTAWRKARPIEREPRGAAPVALAARG